MSRFVRPETKTLTLANGDTLLVARRLTHGEHAAALARMYLAGVDGRLHVNYLATGMGTITAYLLEWSLTDDQGQPVVIKGLSADDLTAVLNNLSPEDFSEILEAVTTHELAMAQEREDAKKKTAGVSASSATSPSPSAVDGPSPTSAP